MKKAGGELERAWKWRDDRGFFAETDALRVFHGPGEGSGPLASCAIDRFGDHGWVTCWGDGGRAKLAEISEFLKAKGARSAVALVRPERGAPLPPETLFGSPASGRIEVKEGTARFGVQLLGTLHPGLFLDHAPLRRWLERHARGWSVLNTFAYTGSLSVAAGLGGARHVATLDLSKPSVAWARENWERNGLPERSGEFVAEDVFDRLPRWAREGRRFDCVILDPPSFSRGRRGSFSTAKDLAKLHALAFGVLEEGGVLVTSINSAGLTWRRLSDDVAEAASKARLGLEWLGRIEQPETFPTRFADFEGGRERYLKGWILRVSSGGSGASKSSQSRDIG